MAQPGKINATHPGYIFTLLFLISRGSTEVEGSTHCGHLITHPFPLNTTMTTSVEYKHTPYSTRSGTCYKVDPFGNVIFAYKHSADSSRIYKEIKRLLKVSDRG